MSDIWDQWSIGWLNQLDFPGPELTPQYVVHNGWDENCQRHFCVMQLPFLNFSLVTFWSIELSNQLSSNQLSSNQFYNDIRLLSLAQI